MASAILRNPKFTAFDSAGAPLVGGKVHTYAVGTTTNKTTYDDNLLANPNTNPVILDSRGEADIWFEGPIKLVLKDSDNVTIWTFDNIGEFITGDALSIDAGTNLYFGAGSCIMFEGLTADDYEMLFCGGDPTADRVINLPDATGTVVVTPMAQALDGNGNTITKTPAAINAQVGTTYELVEADGNKLVTLTNASAITVTLSSGLDTGFTCTTAQLGAGTVTYTTAGSIISKDSKVSQNGQGTGAVLVHQGSNVWWVVGDLA